MKKFGILIMMLFVFGVVSTTLKAQTEDAILDSAKIQSIFTENPYLYVHAYSNPWIKSALIHQNYQVFNNVWNYQRKQTKEMVIGLGIGTVGIIGMIYAVNMPVPIRQVNNSALDDEADKAQRDRRIVGASSIVIGAVGAVIFARSFRWTKRMKAEIGLQSLRLEWNLTGNRRYYKGKQLKKLKTNKHRWTY